MHVLKEPCILDISIYHIKDTPRVAEVVSKSFNWDLNVGLVGFKFWVFIYIILV